MPRAREPAVVTLDLSLAETSGDAGAKTTELLLDYKHQGYLEKHVDALANGCAELYYGPCFRSVPGTTVVAFDCDMLKADIKSVTRSESGQISLRCSEKTRHQTVLLVEDLLLLPKVCIETSRIDLGNQEYDVEMKFESSFSYADWSRAVQGGIVAAAQRSRRHGAYHAG